MKFRLVISVILLAIFSVGILAFSRFWHHRQTLRQQRQQAKAPEVKITVIEGWTSHDIADMLKKQQGMDSQAFLKAVSAGDSSAYSFLKTKPAHASLEGFLFPDTYLVPKNPTPGQIITKMLDNFEQRLKQGGIDPAMASYTVSGSGRYSLYQILTLASIIEKETGRNTGALNDQQKASLDSERKIIAGIFYNRLVVGMALESDATINYITGKNDPAAQGSDLTVDSPYNTYKYRGLPPGPISNPSLSSLMAAFFPTKTEYVYFFHKQPSGEVVYSKTFDEHRQKKIKYLNP